MRGWSGRTVTRLMHSLHSKVSAFRSHRPTTILCSMVMGIISTDSGWILTQERRSNPTKTCLWIVCASYPSLNRCPERTVSRRHCSDMDVAANHFIAVRLQFSNQRRTTHLDIFPHIALGCLQRHVLIVKAVKQIDDSRIAVSDHPIKNLRTVHPIAPRHTIVPDDPISQS
jgi:hypothetical protein